MRSFDSLLLTALVASPVLARQIPANVQSLYNSIRAQGQCKNILKGGFYSQEGDSKSKPLENPSSLVMTTGTVAFRYSY
jgi:hypothetical protein